MDGVVRSTNIYVMESLLLLKPQMSSGIWRWCCPQQGCICYESRAATVTAQPYLRSGGVIPDKSSRCRPTQPERGTGSGPACYKLPTASSYAAHSEMLRIGKGRRKGTESAQRDKPLDRSRGEAASSLDALACSVVHGTCYEVLISRCSGTACVNEANCRRWLVETRQNEEKLF